MGHLVRVFFFFSVTEHLNTKMIKLLWWFPLNMCLWGLGISLHNRSKREWRFFLSAEKKDAFLGHCDKAQIFSQTIVLFCENKYLGIFKESTFLTSHTMKHSSNSLMVNPNQREEKICKNSWLKCDSITLFLSRCSLKSDRVVWC